MNISDGFVDGLLRTKGLGRQLQLGGIEFETTGQVLRIEDDPVISIWPTENGRLEVSLRLYDDADLLVADVDHNVWSSSVHIPWDIESRYHFLRLHQKQRDIQFEIDASGEVIKIRGRFWRHGDCFDVGSDSLTSPNYVTFKNIRLTDIYLHWRTVRGTKKFSMRPKAYYDDWVGTPHIADSNGIVSALR